MYDAFGRHNFGDLLFPHIVVNLLMFKNKNININDFIFCDLFDRDLTSYGGHNVSSITLINNEENLSHIIMVGGEICNCPLNCGILMFDPEPDNTFDMELKLSILNKHFNICYILDKKFLKNDNVILIANSISGLSSCSEEVKNILNNYNYVSTRDSNYDGNYNIVPDCAILTKYLFDNKIQSFKNELSFLEINNKYIVFQFSYNLIDTISNISNYLKIPIYLFIAGIAPYHDSFEEYEKIINKINQETIYGIHIFKETNIWKICYLIANSYITIGTSLHVRIIAFCYSKIRFTFSNNIDTNSKHNLFINKWDNIPNSYTSTDKLFDIINMLNNEQILLFNNNENLTLAINEYKTKAEKWLKLFD